MLVSQNTALIGELLADFAYSLCLCSVAKCTEMSILSYRVVKYQGS